MSTSTKSGACVTSYSKEKIKRKRKENFKEPCCYFDLQEMVHGLKKGILKRHKELCHFIKKNKYHM